MALFLIPEVITYFNFGKPLIKVFVIGVLSLIINKTSKFSSSMIASFSLENELLRKINNFNCQSKIVKWTLTKGKNESGAIDIRLHVEADIPAIGNVITSQFWNTHWFIYHAIEETWAELEDIFSNNDRQIEAPKFSGAENMNLDKTELMEMFDSYLDEKFSNT